MQTLFEVVQAMPAWQKLVWIIVCMSFGGLLEWLIPLVKDRPNWWRHARVNGVFLLTTMAINSAVGAMTLGLFSWIEAQGIGLLHWWEGPLWLELVVALVLFDLIGQYTVHYLLHQVPLLWRLHQVHHSDPHVDVTTGTRHHPLDFLVRETFALLAVVVIGAPLAFYLVYRLLTVFFTYLTHANISFPPMVERVLGWVFVTPDLHKIHHHDEVPWTDRNYGNMLSIWDRLFKTMDRGDVHAVRYGLDITDAERGNDLGYQMRLPFRKNMQPSKATRSK